jgi:ribosomal protein S21
MTADSRQNKDQLIQAFLKGGDKTIETKKQFSDDYLSEFAPIEVKVFGHNFERAFKNFRYLVQKERILSAYKEKQSFEKPSDKKRRKRNESMQKQLEAELKRKKLLSGDLEKELEKKQKQKEQKRKLKEESKS